MAEKINISQIKNSLIINKKFVSVDASNYTEEAFSYILGKIDEAGSIGFITNKTKDAFNTEVTTHKIYAKGQWYNDFDELKYFSAIKAKNADGEIIGNTMVAPNAQATLTIQGKGLTYVTTDPSNGTIIIETTASSIEGEYESLSTQIDSIKNSYLSKDIATETYQEKLTAGNNIIIDNNTISTYGLATTAYVTSNFATLSYVYQLGTDIDALANAGYVNEDTVSAIAAQTASEAVAKIVNGADGAFDTLKEISDWITSAGNYTEASSEYITNNPKDKYYYKDENNIYKDASYDAEGNIILEDGKTLYTFTAQTASDIITNINNLDTKIGTPSYYTYNGIIYEGNVNNNNGTYLGDNNEILTYHAATGIYKMHNVDIDNLNIEIKAITDTLSGILYNLSAESKSSYVSLSIDPETNTGEINRKIMLDISEGEFNDNTGNITKNGLATAYLVNSMINYVNDWQILNGNQK